MNGIRKNGDMFEASERAVRWFAGVLGLIVLVGGTAAGLASSTAIFRSQLDRKVDVIDYKRDSVYWESRLKRLEETQARLTTIEQRLYEICVALRAGCR